MTFGRRHRPLALITISKDREVAASHHGDTPYSGNSLTSVPVTPYTTSVDVNLSVDHIKIPSP